MGHSVREFREERGVGTSSNFIWKVFTNNLVVMSRHFWDILSGPHSLSCVLWDILYVQIEVEG